MHWVKMELVVCLCRVERERERVERVVSTEYNEMALKVPSQ